VSGTAQIPVAGREIWQLDASHVLVTAELLRDFDEYRRLMTPVVRALLSSERGTALLVRMALAIVTRHRTWLRCVRDADHRSATGTQTRLAAAPRHN
jgi:hypothetical protein